MSLNPQDLEKITDLTLDHYKARAEDFWEGTRDHNVNQNIVALLQCIKGEPLCLQRLDVSFTWWNRLFKSGIARLSAGAWLPRRWLGAV